MKLVSAKLTIFELSCKVFKNIIICVSKPIFQRLNCLLIFLLSAYDIM